MEYIAKDGVRSHVPGTEPETCAWCRATLPLTGMMTTMKISIPGKTMTDAASRKNKPIARGVLDYFPDALLAVSEVSRIGNEQHHPGQPLHWDKSKSTDEADALLRHLVDRGTYDTDGARHSAKVAWRALALLQRELDAEKENRGILSHS